MMKIAEPTGDQCDKNEIVFYKAGKVGYAIWSPQIGGYAGKSVAIMDKEWNEKGKCADGGCIDVCTWHDGEFPNEDSPHALHFCDPDQIISFGESLKKYNELGRKDG